MSDKDQHGAIEGSAEELPPAAAPTPVPTGQELERRAAGGTELIPGTSPADKITKASAVATALKGVVDKQGMTTKIGDKDHLQVEAWQTLGTLLGIVPDLVWARPAIGEDGHPRLTEYTVNCKRYGKEGNKRVVKEEGSYDVHGFDWEARVEVRAPDGTLVGSGESLCSRAEERWSRADDFAVKSMAITRATSRAMKGAAGWVVTMAGYSATPAEEMTGDHGGTEGKTTVPAAEWAKAATGDKAKAAKSALAFLLMRGEKASVPKAIQQECVRVWNLLADAAGLGSGKVPLIAAEAIIQAAVALDAQAAGGGEDKS